MFFKKKPKGLLKKFFIIDDEEDIREYLNELLNDLYQCENHLFDNLEKALKCIDEQSIAPDLIISDVNMPGKSGFRLHDEIKNRNLDIPIILITGTPGDEIFEGKRVVISKPFNTKKIKKLIDDRT